MPHAANRCDFKFKDIGLFFLAEQIYRDYEEFIKNTIMPSVSEKYGIKIRELLVLICVERAHGSCGLSEIANMMRKDPATLTRSAVVLTGKELINVEQSRFDSRSKVLTLTAKGRDAILDYQTLMMKSEAYLISEQACEAFQAMQGEEYIIPDEVAERASSLAELSASPTFLRSLISDAA